jgi:hypothetical protein
VNTKPRKKKKQKKKGQRCAKGKNNADTMLQDQRK